ncbi:MAG: urease accessory protein UreE [Desulfovibrionaceae bacterium]|nr:urease accessory protein UreE [Desulfovibrionaceae bacterium]
MELVEQVLGNIHEEPWKTRLTAPYAEGDVDWLDLNQWDAQKNRLRATSAGGRDLALCLNRGQSLRDGDILLWDEGARRAVAARIHLCEVMTLSLHRLARRPQAELMEGCVRLGHALGNQHWPAVIRDLTVYVPVSVDRAVMAAVMDSHRFGDIGVCFVNGDSAAAALSPEERRQLFGGADMPGHRHAHDPGPGHRHGHKHEHTRGHRRKAAGGPGCAGAGGAG